MKSKICDFWNDEDAAVTVDWVVLTAGIIGLALLALIPIGYGSTSLASQVADWIRGADAEISEMHDSLISQSGNSTD